MTTFDRIADAVERLAQPGTSPSLTTLASDAELSAPHFQRTFTRLVGVSPLRFKQVLSAEAAREALLRSESVLSAAWDAGLSGPGRLHDTLIRIERMTPGELKQGLELKWDELETDLGTLTFAVTPRGVCGATFAGLEDLQERWPRATFTKTELSSMRNALQRALTGDLQSPLTFVLKGTDLQLAVWRALLTMPEGVLTTYGALADRIGHPQAPRAVANAVGANPIAWLIPCHRVIRGTGALGGYRWGIGRKSVLLARELQATTLR